MKTRSGQKKYGFLGLRSGRGLGLIRKKAPTSRAVVISLVEDVRLDKFSLPVTECSRPCAWILTHESSHTKVYGTTREGHMDWRVVPWDNPNGGLDVAWIIRMRKRHAVVHFDRLDITVAQAASALRRSIIFSGGDVVFDPRTAMLDTACDGKNTVWERRTLLRDAVPKTNNSRVFLPCSFC